MKLPFFLLLLYILYFCSLWKTWLEIINLICLLQQETFGLVDVLYYMFTFYITDFLSWLIPFSHKIYVFSEIFQFWDHSFSIFIPLFVCLQISFKHNFSWNSHIFRCFIIISIEIKVYFDFHQICSLTFRVYRYILPNFQIFEDFLIIYYRILIFSLFGKHNLYDLINCWVLFYDPNFDQFDNILKTTSKQYLFCNCTAEISIIKFVKYI